MAIAKKTYRSAAAASAGTTPAAGKLAAPAAYKLSKGAMPEAQSARIDGLLSKLRQKRLLEEAKFSDVVVVWPSHDAAEDSEELRMMVRLAQGPGAVLADLAGAVPVPRSRTPKVEVLKRLDSAVVMKANSSALLAMRNRSPGLRMAPSAWAYLQYVRPLGDELDEAALQVAQDAKVKRCDVLFTDEQGKPVAGVHVKALLDWEGAHVSATTGADGVASLGVPVTSPRVEMIVAEPQHSYWSVFTDGFARTDAPRKLSIAGVPLVPDEYQLPSHYAPYDGQAGQGVTVGVIDCGVGPHGVLKVSGGACLVTGEDPDDFLDNGVGHGTHVAGIIAASLASDSKVYGLAPACRLMAYRVCPKSGQKERAASADIAAALQRAIEDRCDIVNISMGSLAAMPEVPDLLEKARNAGIVVFAATGNDGRNELRYPSRYSHAMAVGALGRDATFPGNCPESFHESGIRRGKEFVAEFSNYGMETDFIAPGVAVVSTYPGGKYAMMSGTSMATPYSAGMAARILSKRPEVLNMVRGPERADALIHLLIAAARKVGWSAEYEGFGVLVEK